MRPTASVIPILALVGTFLALPSAAQNLLVNPDFTSNVASWSSDLLIEYSSIFGLPTPGSAQLTDFGFGGSTRQCVDVSSLPTGEPLAFGAYLRGGNHTFQSSTVMLQMIWYESTDCSEPNIIGGVGSRSNNGTHPAGEWFRIDCFVHEGCAPVKPAGANSLRFEVLEAIAIYEMNFFVDGFFLERDLLFRDGFELGGTGEWSGTTLP